MTDSQTIYKTIRDSIMSIVDAKLTERMRNGGVTLNLYPKEMLSLVDEMCRNASHAVVMLMEAKPQEIPIIDSKMDWELFEKVSVLHEVELNSTNEWVIGCSCGFRIIESDDLAKHIAYVRSKAHASK